jgi:hypothetical protein
MRRFADTQGKENSPSATYTCESASVRRLKKITTGARPQGDALLRRWEMSDLSPQSWPKRTLIKFATAPSATAAVMFRH